MVAPLAEIPWPRGRTRLARIRLRGEACNRQRLATVVVPGDANRQAPVTVVLLVREMPVTEVQEQAIRVRLAAAVAAAVAAEVETASGIAVFLAVTVEAPVAPARLKAVPAGTAAAAHAAVVHAAHPACELPAAPEAGGGGDE